MRYSDSRIQLWESLKSSEQTTLKEKQNICCPIHLSSYLPPTHADTHEHRARFVIKTSIHVNLAWGHLSQLSQAIKSH